MGAFLFVHHDPAFRDRIKNEAREFPASQVLVRESLQGSLEAITNPSVILSAIYISVTDLDLSLLQVMEQLLILRPVTPLFLLDHEMNPGVRRLAIQGAFDSKLPLKTLLLPLQESRGENPPEWIRAHPSDTNSEEFLAVPICDFQALKILPYDVFTILGDGTVLRIGVRGDDVDHDQISRLSEKIAFVHIKKDELFEAKTYIQEARRTYLDLSFVSPEWKASEILTEARKVLKELRGDPLSDLTVERTLFFLERLMSHLENLDQGGTQDPLNSFLFRAQKSDQALSTLSLAILYCSKMKIQRATIIEILALASLLQDLSLYQSPFGNLSEKDPRLFSFEEKTYYMNHPVFSADLVAASTSLPEVVIQVIRQHHERKDRTGFPNRTGGPQLHPVAEILSLLNSYLEIQASPLPENIFIKKLMTEILPHYSKAVTAPFLRVVEELSFTKRSKSV